MNHFQCVISKAKQETALTEAKTLLKLKMQFDSLTGAQSVLPVLSRCAGLS